MSRKNYGDHDYINDYNPTEEEDNEMIRRLAEPEPGNFHCWKCTLIYLEQLGLKDEQWLKENGKTWDDVRGSKKTDDQSTTTCSKHGGAGSSSGVGTSTKAKDDKGRKGGQSKIPSTSKVQQPTARGDQQTRKRTGRVAGKSPTKKVRDWDAPEDENEIGQMGEIENNDVDNEPPIAENVADACARPEEIAKPPVPKYQQAYMPTKEEMRGFYRGRRSLYTAEEHFSYVGVLLNLSRAAHFTDHKNTQAKKYKDMAEKLRKETDKFNDYIWSPDSKNDEKKLIAANNVLPTTVHEFAKEWFKRKKAMLNLLPPRYFIKGTHYVSMPLRESPVLTFSQHLLDVGNSPPLTLPDVTVKCTVDMENPESQAPRYWKILDQSLSKDENIHRLKEKFNCDFACTASALRAILLWRGSKLSDECELPIHVRQSYTNGDRSFVVISKPLPPREMSRRQMMLCRAKAAFKEKLFGTDEPMEAQPTPSNEPVYNNWSYNYQDSRASDTDSVTSEMQSPASTPNYSPNTPTYMPQDDWNTASYSPSYGPNSPTYSPSTPVYAPSPSYEPSPPPNTRQSRSIASANPPEADDVLGGIMQSMETVSVGRKAPAADRGVQMWNIGGANTTSESSESYVKSPKGIRQYNMFELKDYKILVRSNLDGLASTGAKNPLAFDHRVSISTIVEYQARFGAEARTNDEMINDWLTGFLKQSERHYRGRIMHAKPYHVLRLEELDKHQMQNVPTGVGIEQMISTGMRRLYVLLSDLKGLDSGDYLIRFNANAQSSYDILRAVEENMGQVIDIKKQYDKIDYAEAPPKVETFDECRRLIDPAVVLQWHKIARRIPASFPPRENYEEPMLEMVLSKPKKKKRKTKQQKAKEKNYYEKRRLRSDDSKKNTARRVVMEESSDESE